MARTIELDADELVLRYSGLGALLRVTSEVRLPYDSIVAVSVGIDRLPHPFTMRVGLNGWPTDLRRGQFWIGGRRVFYDVGDRRRAVVLELRDQPYARIVVEPDTDPEQLAEEIRRRSPWVGSPAS
jgi:hypothetical protein